MKTSEPVSVSTFRSTADALIAQGILDEAGIESMIRSDNAGGMYPAMDGTVCWSERKMSPGPTKRFTGATVGRSEAPMSRYRTSIAIPHRPRAVRRVHTRCRGAFHHHGGSIHVWDLFAPQPRVFVRRQAVRVDDQTRALSVLVSRPPPISA